ncbi:DUF4844 domain-containing protein [Polluticaenibacter yanchengensis]|uniref:DUF4844 domain-containing protein n=1 Tax=Polluticaenibacter yanchengensis TaxID=3014562 RepID=A0ABT4UHR2_9BACT|nr:DUF4844 domain-containing protein [Chitinophagaceae bacterium LY-5]
MKQIVNILLVITFSFLTACENGQIKTPDTVMNKFEEFKSRDKFLADPAIYYPGIADLNLKPTLNEKLNLAADDFKEISESKNPTEKDYQNKIEIGLKRFSDIYINLDTEDRERVCLYFEELMDIVDLESSGGHLINFMYGFDPTK